MIEPDDVSGADAEATANRLRTEAHRLRDRATLLEHAAAYLAHASGDGALPSPRFVQPEDFLDH